MNTQVVAYKNIIVSRANQIADELARADALVIIEQLIPLRDAIVSLSGNTVSSYSISGRSVTKRDLPSLRSEEAALKRELAAYIELPVANSVVQTGGVDFSEEGF